jgi:hypothetical protein
MAPRFDDGSLSVQTSVRFSLRPGTEDPGPASQRKGLLATFNGGFKLDSAGGGFYLNGIYHGTLEKGAASVVYYKNGTVKIGQWGREFTMVAAPRWPWRGAIG